MVFEKQKKWALILLTALHFISGCQEEPEGKSNESVKVEAKLEPVKEAPGYKVKLSWLDATEGDSWVILRSDPSSEQRKHLVTLQETDRSYEDGPVNEAGTYKYFLGHLGTRTSEAWSQATIEIPKDILFKKGNTQIDSNITAKRMFFESGSHVITNGKNIRITVEELISNDGTLESFPPDAIQAQFSAAGRAGGKIKIFANKGKGNLQIIARGENGGVGKRGETGKKGEAGFDGKPGKCGHKENENYCSYSPSDIGRIRESATFSPAAKKLIDGFFCALSPTSGSGGSRGGTGSHGSVGGIGGDSAKVHVKIQDASTLLIDIQSEPGKGGQGGKGGSGGEGGKGGKAGSRDEALICESAWDGHDGEKGFDGEDGLIGKDGSSSPTCLELGNEITEGCSFFYEHEQP